MWKSNNGLTDIRKPNKCWKCLQSLGREEVKSEKCPSVPDFRSNGAMLRLGEVFGKNPGQTDISRISLPPCPNFAGTSRLSDSATPDPIVCTVRATGSPFAPRLNQPSHSICPHLKKGGASGGLGIGRNRNWLSPIRSPIRLLKLLAMHPLPDFPLLGSSSTNR